MSYTILKQYAFDTLPYRLKVIRKKPPRDAKGVILVQSTVDLQLIPEDSILYRPIWSNEPIWEIHLPKTFDKSVKKVAKTLDAVAFM